MATSTLKLSTPTTANSNTTNTTNDSNSNSNMSSPDTVVGFDLKRLKVYSSCLRCRAKKVKCDRKEPCSRCVHHRVECSYRELASVKLDIRPFKRHTPASNTNSINIITTAAINKPKIKKDTKDAPVPVVAPTPTFATTPNFSFSSESTHVSSSTTASTVISPPSPNHMSSVAVEDTPYYPYHNYSSNSSPSSSPHPTNTTLNPRATDIVSSDTPISASLKTSGFPAASSSSSKDRAKVHKIHRRKPSVKVSPPDVSESDGFEQVDRVKLSEFTDSSMAAQEDYADVPIWRTQAIGKHTQTAHEQDMADTFGLAAYLQAREMEIRKDPGKAGQTIDYEMELEMALAQRMPTSFSRSDRLPTRSSRRTSYNPTAAPYARPSYCQLSSPSHSSYSKGPSITSPKSPSSTSPVIVDLKDYTAPPQSALCCCQIAAQQGRAFNSCPYSNVSHSGYEKPALASLASAAQSISLEGAEPSRIAYSPSYTPEYEGQPKDRLPKLDWSSILPPPPRIATEAYPSTKMDISSPTTELAPIRLPIIVSPTSSTSSSSLENALYEVGRDDDEPVQIECKYNEPNVDAWDMIEKPISRTVSLATKRGRSVKMEMGWILS
ncbi:hypothetical protein BGZ74_002400 [Mortierella antarctica]|nr:hypothetical protein BGZ74_002400 [Mortierella antarctica]